MGDPLQKEWTAFDKSCVEHGRLREGEGAVRCEANLFVEAQEEWSRREKNFRFD